MTLPITLTIAAAAALVSLWLAVRVGRVRMAAKVLHGDGGNPLLIQRMRAQSNFVEYTPFVLILIGLIEAARGTHGWLWATGLVYILARIAHAFGMDRTDTNPWRGVGFAVTGAVLAGLALYALTIVYQAPAAHGLLVTAP